MTRTMVDYHSNCFRYLKNFWQGVMASLKEFTQGRWMASLLKNMWSIQASPKVLAVRSPFFCCFFFLMKLKIPRNILSLLVNLSSLCMYFQKSRWSEPWSWSVFWLSSNISVRKKLTCNLVSFQHYQRQYCFFFLNHDERFYSQTSFNAS